MPRASREERAAHHERILDAASRLVRERGPDGVSVPDVMGAVGLTPGGFYKHFDSKDDLVARAGAAAFTARADTLQGLVADDPATGRERFVDGYLSERHRDHPGAGCPAAALATDVGRPGTSEALRAEYADGVRGLVATLTELGGDDRTRAVADLATMVGAVLLARATAGDPLSEEFLHAARERVAEPRRGTRP